MRIGILSPSEIAYRRFMPALNQIDGIEFAGIAVATQNEWFKGDEISEFDKIKEAEVNKAQKFIDEFGGKLYLSYMDLIEDDTIDAIYVPLPPALHYKWAKCVLENNKHVLVEKPATIDRECTAELINIAKEKQLAFYENYMFVYHSQIEKVLEIASSGEIGKVWKYNIAFGFPRRALNDFRYNKELGGGALIDCGGYTIKFANMLIENAELKYAKLVQDDIKEDIDIFGNAIYTFGDKIVEVEFGMDHDYRCSLEIWGSEGSIKTNRILTAPVGYMPVVDVYKNGEKNSYELSSDDTFLKSIKRFICCVSDVNEREKVYGEVQTQADRVDEFIEMVKKG